MNTNWSEIMGDGLIITVVGYVIVFTSLVILYLAFTWIAKLMNLYVRKRLEREGKPVLKNGKTLMVPGDEGAAIAMALYLYNELHDEESTILTIDRVSKIYSPWSSKIYNLRNF
jgi:Na+-transporting methylmalonyl-CoA/oxaloacetate decarboxylase gamma subunit